MIELQFLKYCLGNDQSFPQLDDEQWKSIYDFCVKQSIAGVAFEWLQVSGYGLKVPKQLLLQWLALSEQIKRQNQKVNQNAVCLGKLLEKDGFDYCILKGQGNTLGYPNPYSRTPGDIDVWIIPKEEGRDKKCVRNPLYLH